MTQPKLFLFGPPRLELDGELVAVSLRKGLALLAYLTVTRQPHSRDALATLFWPESDQRSARASLRRTLYRLNKEVGEELLLATAETIELDPELSLWLDVEAFRILAEAGLGEEQATPEAVQKLVAAEELYQDDFMAGFTLPDCPTYDEWQFFQQEGLRQTLVRVLMQLVDVHQAKGAWEPAIYSARRWLSLDPLHEPTHRRLMRLYAWSGQQAAALRQYEECVQVVQEELGVEVEAETTAFYQAIRTRRLPPPQQAPATFTGDTPAVARSAPAIPQTHYVRSGDVHIAYQVCGNGPVDVLFVNGFVSHLEHVWTDAGLADFLHRLAAHCRLILFDKRGVGLSDRVGRPPTLEDTMDDVLAVMDAVGTSEVILFGVSEGGPNSALLAATYPDRVRALILYGTLPKFTRAEDYPWALRPEQWDKWTQQIVDNWGGPVSLGSFAPSRAHDPEFQQWWAQMLRLASSPGGVRAVLQVARDIDVRHVLSAIRVPTLVLHQRGDRIMRAGGARYMAQQIPGARYVELDGEDHWWWLSNAGALLKEIRAFIQALEAPLPAERMLATVLFCELVGAQGEASKRTFEDAMRELLQQYRGSDLGNTDGRYLLSFDGPSRALRYAGALRDRAQEQGLALRIGLHTGECELTPRGLGGLAVEIATTVMAAAAPGEILAPRTVTDLVAGSGFSFEDRGLHDVAGPTTPWRLFALI